MLNDQQAKMLGDVKSGFLSRDEAIRVLQRLEQEHYQMASLREFLFALDGTLKLASADWTEVFVNRLAAWGGYVVDGVMTPQTTTEIGSHIEEHNMSDQVLSLLVYLLESSSKRPNNAVSFVRRCFREFYSGIQPISDERLLVIERFMKYRSFESEDFLLAWHLVDESKGLENTKRLPVSMAVMIADKCQQLLPSEKKRYVFDPLERVDEVCGTIECVLETLKSQGEKLPERLLVQTDQTLELLSGI